MRVFRWLKHHVNPLFLMGGVLSLLSACSTTLEIDALRQSEPAFYADVQSPLLPFFPQQDYQCGPAALAMVLAWSGVDVTPDELVPLVYLPLRQGSLQIELVGASRQFKRLPYVLSPSFTSLMSELKAGHPVIVMQNLGLSWYPKWHYAVVIGMDLALNQIYLHSGTTKRYVLNLDTFERTWGRAEKWALVVLPPDRLPASVDVNGFLKSVAYFDRQGTASVTEPAYNMAVKRWPGNIVINMALANINYHRHDLAAATLLYQSVITQHPAYAPAHNNLAQVLMEQGKAALALLHAEKAVKLGGPFADKYRETLEDIMVLRDATPQ